MAAARGRRREIPANAGPPLVVGTGTARRVVLDWSGRQVLHHRRGCRLCCGGNVSGPPPDPCQFCKKTAHFLDADGRPVHKFCLEVALTPESDRRSAA